MNLFSELSLSSILQQNLTRNCLVTPTPVQAKAIPVAMSGSDLVATAQTGTGKTLAFLLPMLEKLMAAPKTNAISALILTPTRELAMQIKDSFDTIGAGTGFRAAVVVGGINEKTQLSAIRRGVHVVIATPGRLEDFTGRRLVNLSSIQTVVLDEADRMLDMGFAPAIERILAPLPVDRQNMFFSATMEKSVERLITRHSKNAVRINIGAAATTQPLKIDIHMYEVDNDRKLPLLHHMISKQEGSFLVFARTKHGTDRLAKRLSRLGTKAVAMHGDRTQSQRNQALAGFRDGRYRVMVATDVAARGIHVDSIAHVVNFDLPQAPEDFIHRIGRTGRAGQSGTASTFSLRSERNEMRRIERECKVQFIRQEISPEVPSFLAESAFTEPEIQDEPVSRRMSAGAGQGSRGPVTRMAGESFRPSRESNGSSRDGRPMRTGSGKPHGPHAKFGRKSGPPTRFAVKRTHSPETHA